MKEAKSHEKMEPAKMKKAESKSEDKKKKMPMGKPGMAKKMRTAMD